MLILLKGLPLAYQRDLQDDKPPLFGAIRTLEGSLGVMSGLVATLSIDRGRMRAAADEGYTTATAVADALVGQGVPFRSAHHIVGSLVGEAERGGIGRLQDLPDEAFARALGASDDPRARELSGIRVWRRLCARRRASKAPSRGLTWSAARTRSGSRRRWRRRRSGSPEGETVHPDAPTPGLPIATCRCRCCRRAACGCVN